MLTWIAGVRRFRIRHELSFQFFIACLKDFYQRSVSQRFTGSANLRESPAFTKHADEGFGISADLSKNGIFFENNRPGKEREGQKDNQDSFGERTGCEN